MIFQYNPQATAASLNDDYFKKKGFMWMLNDDDKLFVNTTIYDYLWHYRSSVVDRVYNLLPFLVPTNNSGCLHQVNIYPIEK